MLVEALFWFHPLVWWLGARLIDERERACDEEVLETGSQAHTYAESILKVCEFYVESPLTCLSGITGSDLKKRIRRVMRSSSEKSMGTCKRLLLMTAGIVALAMPIVAGVLIFPGPRLNQIFGANGREDVLRSRFGKAEQDAKGALPPTFPWKLMTLLLPPEACFRPRTRHCLCYLRFAYKSTLSTPGLPAWGRTDRFDIEARASGQSHQGPVSSHDAVPAGGPF